jgi:hypothetical protein
MIPQRIQRKRTKGWRLPPNTVCVTRPGRWGNPYYKGIYSDYTAQHAVDDYKRWIAGDYAAKVWAGAPPTRKEIRQELAGKKLACWCKPGEPCHGDILLKIANSRR